MRSLRVRAVLAGALVLGVGGSATLAAWTDQELASTVVTAGTFSLSSRTSASAEFTSHGGGAEGTATMAFDATGFYPGVSKSAWIQIRNDGTVPGTVNLSNAVAEVAAGTASPLLRDWMRVRFVPLPTGDTTSCTPGIPGGVSTDGLNALPALSPLPVAAGAMVGYCIVLTLPANTPTEAQGGSATPTWTFTGTTG